MRLITLGDNLTNQPGWADYLAQKLNFEHINLSEKDGTNESQIFRMQDFLFENNIKFTDIYIWQLTATTTPENQIGSSLDDALNNPSKYYCYLTNQKKNTIVSSSLSEEEQLNQIFSMLVTIRKLCDRILIFRGWRETISIDQRKPFSSLLSSNKIQFLSETPIDWCAERNMFFNTNGTPSYESQVEFCNKIIIPKLNLMKWI